MNKIILTLTCSWTSFSTSSVILDRDEFSLLCFPTLCVENAVSLHAANIELNPYLLVCDSRKTSLRELLWKSLDDYGSDSILLPFVKVKSFAKAE